MSSTPTLVLWFVIHLPSLSSQEGVLFSLISLVMVPLDQSLAEYKVQQRPSSVTLNMCLMYQEKDSISRPVQEHLAS